MGEEVHNVAEILEHAHEIADSLDQKLGSPTQDPHGQEIPKAKAE
jgi:Mn-dependent DtxR family transcriptional regulator